MKTLEVFFKNLFLSILLVFNKSPKNSEIPQLNRNSKILLIRLNRIGDALVSTPLINVLKNKLKCQIHILADRKNHFVFANNRDVDKILINEKGVFGFPKTIKKINSENYDVVVDLHDDVSTTVSFFIALSKAPQKFALEKENKKIFTKTISKPDAESVHVVDRILRLSKLFNIDYQNDQINIKYYLPEISLDKAEQFISEHAQHPDKLLGINISAGSDARFWGIDRYQKLLDLFEKYSFDIIILTAPKDLEKAESISNNRFPIYFSNDFDNFCAVISKLKLLFTPDTSIIHIASAFEIPTFGIYVKYNTNDMIWSPYRSRFDCIITEESNFDNLDFNLVESRLKEFLSDLGYN